jgi:predicted  nucleic acid-binding Zn-ribbon protein
MNLTRRKKMQEIIEMAKAHLQNVANKIQELNNQKNLLDSEIDKLTKYLNEGITKIEAVTKQETAN